MRRCSILVFSLLARLACVTLASTPVHAQRPIKVFISIDMEGVGGVGTDLLSAAFEYARSRELMTAEALAAIDGARQAGATQFVIADMHGNEQNLIAERFPSDVTIIRPSPRPLGMMQGIDSTFSAAFLIGYYSDTTRAADMRVHTTASATFSRILLNGRTPTESRLNAAVAGYYGVPVALISGDADAVAELKDLVPTAEEAVVKPGIRLNKRATLTPDASQALVRTRARTAIERLRTMKPFLLRGPIELDLTYQYYHTAEMTEFLPEGERVDARTVRHRGSTIVDAARFMGFAIGYRSNLRTLLLESRDVMSRGARESEIRAQVESATRAFLAAWRAEWEVTQDIRRPTTARDGELASLNDKSRASFIHCHWDFMGLRLRQHIIMGRTLAQASCPGWYPVGEPAIEDERHSLDGGLTPVRRLKISQLRELLRSVLDSAAQQLPGDVRMARQRVRFALDADDLSGAVLAAAQCGHEPAQCGLLQGLVLYRAGLAGAADSAFLASAALMSDAARCEWNDIGVLLERDDREAYERMSCAARADVETRLWWLADPLYIEPGNERRAEHYARKVLAVLIAAPVDDARQHMTTNFGAEGVRENLLRYGWPAHMYWAGREVDVAHGKWLEARSVALAPPYVVREYTRDRLRTTPLPSALRAPLQSNPDDWQLNAPHGDDEWWPVEHFAREASRIVQLPLGQSVLLRRRNATRFVWAGDLDTALVRRASGDSIAATFYESRSASDMVIAGMARARVGTPLLIQAPLQKGAALLAIESPGDPLRPAARTRFGIDIPESLSDMQARTALSQPMLFDPPRETSIALDADSAARRMYGTTTFSGLRRTGVYWEAYGFSATDTTDIEVRISRQDGRGVAARIATVFQRGSSDGRSIAIKWREMPGSSRAIHRLEGGVPVQMRSIVLEISELPAGSYLMKVSMTKPGATSVTSERTFILR